MNVSIQLSDEADPAVREVIAGSLGAFNTQMAGIDDYRPLVVTVRDEHGHVVGGLWAGTGYSWLFVALLFVPDALRGQGIGTDLMSRAEHEAIARGYHGAWLDTYKFQARGFYERLGYSCFGELNDYPPGSARYFMKKVLGGSPPGA